MILAGYEGNVRRSADLHNQLGGRSAAVASDYRYAMRAGKCRGYQLQTLDDSPFIAAFVCVLADPYLRYDSLHRSLHRLSAGEG